MSGTSASCPQLLHHQNLGWQGVMIYTQSTACAVLGHCMSTPFHQTEIARARWKLLYTLKSGHVQGLS